MQEGTAFDGDLDAEGNLGEQGRGGLFDLVVLPEYCSESELEDVGERVVVD